MKKIFVLTSLFLSVFHVKAQQDSIARFLYTGISANAYKGDLNHSFSKWSSVFHIGFQLNKKKKLNGSFNVMMGNIVGNNPDYYFESKSTPPATANRYFKTSIFSFHYELHYNLVKKNNWVVYLSQGFGLLRFNPKNENNENLQDQFNTREKNEAYSNTTTMLPTGLGAFYTLPNNFGLGLQAAFLNPGTDYIDNISQLGSRSKKDNVLQYRFLVYIPVKKKS